MLLTSEIYKDVLDTINEAENGRLTIDKFNRFSRRAELRFLDWLSGDISSQIPPEPFLSQKNRDWLTPFIVPFPAQVSGGIIQRPADYYKFGHIYKLGSAVSGDCEDDIKEGCNTPIELVDNALFDERCNTFIEELKPVNKPIVKMLGRTLVFGPSDMGSVVLEYTRYPKFGEIVAKQDQVFNDLVPDDSASTPYEWDDSARDALVWFIVNSYYDSTREQAGKQFNIATGKTVRDGK